MKTLFIFSVMTQAVKYTKYYNVQIVCKVLIDRKTKNVCESSNSDSRWLSYVFFS